MITTTSKQRIIEAVIADSANYSSAKKHAVALGINHAQLSRIKKGDAEQVVSLPKLLAIARRLNVELGDGHKLKAARTPVFTYITTQLQQNQEGSQSSLLCDIADIGKTFAARYYCRSHRNAVYIDCSQVKTKQKLVRSIAKEFGLHPEGRYADVYDDLVFFLKSVEKPLIVLDEAGDLDYSAFLELKALWNATEGNCGWYMMGADGLKVKIERNLGRKKVGYTEIFSRYGSRYQKITPDGGNDKTDFIMHQVSLIARANSVNNVQELYAKTGGSLRRISIEIKKMKDGTK
jgi:hypothetical protein